MARRRVLRIVETQDIASLPPIHGAANCSDAKYCVSTANTRCRQLFRRKILRLYRRYTLPPIVQTQNIASLPATHGAANCRDAKYCVSTSWGHDVKNQEKIVKPTDFRKLQIPVDTPVSIIGDYEQPSFWSHGRPVRGIIARYLVVERHHAPWRHKDERVWDAAALVSLERTLVTQNDRNEKCTTDEILLILRESNTEWVAGASVHVFGIQQGKSLEQDPLPLSQWRPQTVHLSLEAELTIANRMQD